MSDTHRLHPLHTGRTEIDAVALLLPNAKPCSSCLAPLSPYEKPAFCCNQCDYTVCATCDRPRAHPVHPLHEVYFITPTSPWRCDVCKRASADLNEKQCYYCGQCDFHLCKGCFSGVNSLLHAHTLYRTDVTFVYHQSNGEWNCDVCGKNNGPGHYYPIHCQSCQFDVCDNCIKPWKSSFHPGHSLYKADSNLTYPRFNGGWRCDKCQQSFTPQINNISFHCSQCEFDLCSNCMKDTSLASNSVGFDVPKPAFQGTGIRCGVMVPTTRRGNPIASPSEEVADVNLCEGRPGPPDGTGDCVICQERSKDATIVHGGTGHVCCCSICANELLRRGATCPICRAPIDRIIKQYTV